MVTMESFIPSKTSNMKKISHNKNSEVNFPVVTLTLRDGLGYHFSSCFLPDTSHLSWDAFCFSQYMSHFSRESLKDLVTNILLAIKPACLSKATRHQQKVWLNVRSCMNRSLALFMSNQQLQCICWQNKNIRVKLGELQMTLCKLSLCPNV